MCTLYHLYSDKIRSFKWQHGQEYNQAKHVWCLTMQENTQQNKSELPLVSRLEINNTGAKSQRGRSNTHIALGTYKVRYLLSLRPLQSNLGVSTTNNVNLMFNSIKMSKATNEF